MAFFDLNNNADNRMKDVVTPIWKKYEKGLEYITKKRLVSDTNRNWNFYVGRQWEDVESGGEELPSLNFIHPNVMRTVTTIYSNRMAATFSDMDGRAELQPIYDKLNQYFANCWEKANEDIEMRLSIKEGHITGDGLQYFGTSDLSDLQRVQNTAILYGDESETKIQKQPWLIIHQRESVRSVKAQARSNGLSEEEIELIRADGETEYLVGNRDEVDEDLHSPDSKVTTLLYMEKKDGAVYVTRCTKSVVYEPEHKMCVTNPDGTEGKCMTRYPIAKFSYEDYPNDARGVSQVKKLIPNQIEINRTLARRSITTKMTAFPRIAYDSTMIQNPEALERVGMPIEVNTGGVQSVNQMITYLSPANTSDEPKKLTDDLLEITQELSGSGDTTMGNIDLQRVAASAITAVNDKAESMHDETVAKIQSFVEDIAWIWLENWQVYSPNGMTVIMHDTDPITGEQIDRVDEITREELEQLKPHIRIEVTKDNSFTREAQQQVIDGLLEKNLISLEEYTELANDTSPVPKTALTNVMKRRKAEAQMQQQMMPTDPEVEQMKQDEAPM